MCVRHRGRRTFVARRREQRRDLRSPVGGRAGAHQVSSACRETDRTEGFRSREWGAGRGSAGCARRGSGLPRTIMRNLSGLPEARGNRSVYVDCPFARAWWRQRLVTRVLGHGDPVPVSAVGYVVRLNKGYWERLTTLIGSRNSVFGSDVVQDALVAALAKLLDTRARIPAANPATSRRGSASDERRHRRPRTRRAGLR